MSEILIVAFTSGGVGLAVGLFLGYVVGAIKTEWGKPK
jgi:ABC-type antimicrobial peptide transport system permease subunit